MDRSLVILRAARGTLCPEVVALRFALVVLPAKKSTALVLLVRAPNNLIRAPFCQLAVVDGVCGMCSHIPQADCVMRDTPAGLGLRGRPRFRHAEAAINPVGRPATASQGG